MTKSTQYADATRVGFTESAGVNDVYPTYSPFTVVYAVDGNFWPHTFVSIYSLLTNNQDISLDVRVLADTLDPVFRARLASLTHSHNNATVTWMEVDAATFANAPVFAHFSPAMYYRLMIGSILPDTIQQVLYLDGDTIIRGSLRELFSLDLGHAVVAAVPEYHPPSLEARIGDNVERLGLSTSNVHFNSGVLQMDLSKWRNLGIENSCLQYIRSNANYPERLRYPDQDTLNVVLEGKWLPIGPTYNYFPWTLDPRRTNDFDMQAQVGGLIPEGGPLIAHYTGKFKPWGGRSPHPYASDYWAYRMQTQYASRLQLLRTKIVGFIHVMAFDTIRPKLVPAIRRLPMGGLLLKAARSALRLT